jgi:hypothetical protein
MPAALAHEANTRVRGLHYVLIYVSYNRILFFIAFVLFLYKQHLGINCERLHMAGLDGCIIL